jgi:hypothetical protein
MLSLVCGCAEFRMPLMKSELEPDIPETATVVWSDTILYQAAQPGVRGFGGRAMFYGRDSKTPIPVDGIVTVYAFDNEEPDQANPKPVRKFVFTADQVAEHYSKSDLGHSYSFWVPWDEVGGEPQKLSLRLRFDGRNGGTFITDGSRLYLPGVIATKETSRNTEIAAADASHSIESRTGIRSAYGERSAVEVGPQIRRTSHEAVATVPLGIDNSQTPKEPESGLSTITIDVPPSFAERLRRSPVMPATEQPIRQQTMGTQQQTTGLSSGIQADVMRTQTSSTSTPASAFSTVSSRFSASQMARSNRYGHSRFPAQRERAFGQVGDPVRRQPHPAKWLSRLQPIPRSGPSFEANSTIEDAQPGRD